MDASKFLVLAGVGNHVADRKVPAPARIVPAFFGARVISSVTTKENEGRGVYSV